MTGECTEALCEPDSCCRFINQKFCCGCCDCCEGCVDGVYDFIVCLKSVLCVIFSIPILLFKILKTLICCGLAFLLLLGLLFLISFLLDLLCGPLVLFIDFLVFGSNLVAAPLVAPSFVASDPYGRGPLYDVPEESALSSDYREHVYEFMQHSPRHMKIIHGFLLQRYIGRSTRRGTTFSKEDLQHAEVVAQQVSLLFAEYREEFYQWMLGFVTGENSISSSSPYHNRRLLQIGAVLDILDCFVNNQANIFCLLEFFIDVPIDLPDFFDDLADFDCDCDDYNSGTCFSLDGLEDVLTAFQTIVSLVGSFIPQDILDVIPDVITDVLFLDDPGDTPSIDDLACFVIESQCFILFVAATFLLFLLLGTILEWLCETFRCLWELKHNRQHRDMYEYYLYKAKCLWTPRRTSPTQPMEYNVDLLASPPVYQKPTAWQRCKAACKAEMAHIPYITSWKKSTASSCDKCSACRCPDGGHPVLHSEEYKKFQENVKNHPKRE